MVKDPKKFRSALVSAVAGVSANTQNTWRKRGLLELEAPDEGGWTAYTLNDLLRVCALAEVNRMGIPITAPLGKRLADEVADDLIEMARDGVPASDKNARRFRLVETLGYGEGEDGEKLVSQVRLRMTLERLTEELQSPASSQIVAVASYIIVDTLKLWHRTTRALREHGVELPQS